MLYFDPMHWELVDSKIVEHIGQLPGGIELVDSVVQALEIKPEHKVLDIANQSVAVAMAIVSGIGCQVTVPTGDAVRYGEALEQSEALGLKEKIKVVQGIPQATFQEESSADRITYIANPLPYPIRRKEVVEFRRVLAPDGMIAIAGPMSFTNDTPKYVSKAMRECGGRSIKTPAYTALMFGREGFHIIRAEYITGAWDLWLDWLDKAPDDFQSKRLREAVIEDQGRWLSMGIVILHKPPKPEWAVL